MDAQKDTEYNATPFSHGAEIVDGCNTDKILEIFGKYWKYLGNIGNIWEILEIFGKYWKYLAAAVAAAAQKESNELVSSA